MAAIRLTATVTEDRHLEIDLPADVPVGPVELTIKPLVSPPEAETNPRREELRAKFIAAGLMSPEPYADPNTVPLSEEQLDELVGPLPTEATEPSELTRDAIRARLKAAGLLSEGRWAPENAEPLSDDERDEFGRLFAGSRLMSDLVDEDRGPR